MRRTSSWAATLALAAMIALSGCTDDPGGEASVDGADANGVEASAGPAEATGSARTVTGSMGEVTSDVPGEPSASANVRGTVTLTLRAVEVSEQTMMVRWAIRWDGEDAEPDAVRSYYELGLGTAASVIDATNLKVYRPFCTDGSWKGEGAVSGIIDAQQCTRTMLSSAQDVLYTKLPNHGTVEGWAAMPAPEGKPATVDVIPVEGVAGFTQAEVTYLDGGS